MPDREAVIKSNWTLLKLVWQRIRTSLPSVLYFIKNEFIRILSSKPVRVGWFLCEETTIDLYDSNVHLYFSNDPDREAAMKLN